MNILLNILEQNYITNIYIGVTGVLVAIVIFIAEVIKDQNNELNKKVILYKTHIKENITDALVIFFYMIIVNMLKYNIDNGTFDLYNIITLISHIFLLIFVIISIYRTGKMFLISLRLNTEKDYFNKELENYIHEKALELEKRANKKNNKKHKKYENEFKDFIKNQEIYSNNESIIKEDTDYEAIYPIKNGIIGTYDFKKLNDLASYFNNQKIAEEKYMINNKNIVYIPNNIGKKVNKKEPIFYCLKEYKNIFENLSDMVIYEDNRLFIDDEIKLINNCLFDFALEYDEPYSYDENNQLFNYFKYLYENKLYGIKALALNNIEDTYRKVYNKFSKNKQFSCFLNTLSFLAYSNEEYNDYEYINSIELYLYINQLEKKNVDAKQIAYNFANNVFRYNMYSVKENSDIRYYDNLVSILFKFIIYLIKTLNYDAIDVLLDNISMERINYKDNDFDEYDIINFQFSCGIIYCLVILSNQNKLEEKFSKNIKNIINYLENYLVNLYDAWDTIRYFKKYYDKNTCVKKAYDNLDFEFVDHKYKSSWSGWCINSTIIIKEFLFIFNIDFVNYNLVDVNQIGREDKYYYQELLKLINNNEPTNLDKYLNTRYNNKSIIDTLNIAVEEAEKKEKEYNRLNMLDRAKVEKFKELIKQNIEKDSNFTKALKKYNKINKSKTKLKKAFGINQLIPRELFFKEVGGYETIAENYCSTLDIGIEKEYIKKIEKISKKSTETLETVLGRIENLQEYIIISNYMIKSYLKKFDYNYKDNVISYSNINIPVLNIPQINGIFLLKKDDLPVISFCDFNEEWNSKNIDNSLYYELIDCSESKEIRNDIINNSKWIKEKGNLEDQENYLKECCRIRLYLAYTITNYNGKSVLKFENKMDN